jgi:hypothetical protein
MVSIEKNAVADSFLKLWFLESIQLEPTGSCTMIECYTSYSFFVTSKLFIVSETKKKFSAEMRKVL